MSRITIYLVVLGIIEFLNVESGAGAGRDEGRDARTDSLQPVIAVTFTACWH